MFNGVAVRDRSVLLYDTGDFVDDYAVDAVLRNDRSFLFVVTADAGVPRELRLVPVRISDCAVHEATGSDARWCRRTMRERSERYGTTFRRADEALVLALDG